MDIHHACTQILCSGYNIIVVLIKHTPSNECTYTFHYSLSPVLTSTIIIYQFLNEVKIIFQDY